MIGHPEVLPGKAGATGAHYQTSSCVQPINPRRPAATIDAAAVESSYYGRHLPLQRSSPSADADL